MKKYLLMIAFGLCLTANAQTESPYALVYKPEIETLKTYLEHGNEQVLLNSVEHVQPLDTFWLGTNGHELPQKRGVYMLVYTANNHLEVMLINQKPLSVFLTMQKQHVAVRLYNDSTQAFVTDADVYEGKKGNIAFTAKEQAYVFSKTFHKNGQMLVVHNGVPTWVDWQAKTNTYNYTYWQRLRYRFQSLYWFVTEDAAYRKEQRDYRKRNALYWRNMSYIATNKPMYRAGDTLRLKAFILNHKDKAYTAPARLELSYYNGLKNKQVRTVIDTLHPYRPGAFSTQIAIADSLLGKNVTLALLDHKERVLQMTEVACSDYTLNQVAFEAELVDEKNAYYPNVPMRISYSALSDLGLSAMEGSIQVTINNVYAIPTLKQPVVVLPNTLLDTTFQADVTGRGIFTIPTACMPKTDISCLVVIKYVAANGETSTKQWHIKWRSTPKKLHLKHHNGLWTIVADSAFNPAERNISLAVTRYDLESRSPYLQRGNANNRKAITLPYTFVQPMPSYWDVYVDDTLALRSADVFTYDQGEFEWTITDSEVMYYREKPQPLPAIAAVYAEGTTLVYLGPLRNDTLRLPKTCRFYTIYHQKRNGYYGKQFDMVWIEPRFKSNGASFLDLAATGPKRIYPGDTATWHLALKDDGDPVPDFDLLAMAYKKKQFENLTEKDADAARAINQKVHYPGIQRERFTTRNSGIATLQPELNKTTVTRNWLAKLRADTLPSYKYRFTPGGVGVHALPLPKGLNTPQFAPFVYRGGEQLTVEAFYVDARVKYIKSVTTWPFSAEVKPGLQTVVIRLNNVKITVPNVRMSEGFKTELALDLAQLPDSIQVEKMPNTYTDAEVAHFRKHVLRFQYSGKYTLTQGNAQVVATSQAHQNYGPFEADKMSFTNGNISLDFPFVGNQTYTLQRDGRLLDRKPLEPYSFKPTMGWHFGANNSRLQLPGLFLQLPEAPPALAAETYHSIPVVTRPLATAPNACAFSSNGFVLRNGYYFAYCSSRKELYHINANALRSYNQNNWLPGTYQLFIIDGSKAFISPPFTIQAEATAHLDITQFSIADAWPTIALLSSLANSTTTHYAHVSVPTGSTYRLGQAEQTGGNQYSWIYGTVVMQNTRSAVGFATITLTQNDTLMSTVTGNADGSFTLTIEPGTYTITCAIAGYVPFSVANVVLAPGTKRSLDFFLAEASETLPETVVLAHAALIEKGKTSSIITVDEIKNLPYRNVGGIVASTAGVYSANDAMLEEVAVLRGSRNGDDVVFIDGVKVRGDVEALTVLPGLLPAQFGDANGNTPYNDAQGNPDKTDDEALERLRGRGGNVRSTFRDFAFFIPDVTTNAKGEARIQVHYPDDVANWQTYFLGMESGKQYAFSAANTLAFSEVSATLATPRYLLQGDSCVLIGKTLNYLDTSLAVQNYFTANGDTILHTSTMLSSVAVHRMPVVVGDSLTATYSMKLAHGFVDGETRSVPVLPVGLAKNTGAFWVLHGDTTVTFSTIDIQLIEVGVMQSMTDFLRDEVDLQLAYVHTCNEQLAGKLRAILAAQHIAATAQRKERDVREAKKIISHLLENRNADMLWGWWGKQETNAWMTAYVLETLLKAKESGYNVPIDNTLSEAADKLAIWPSAQRIDMIYAFNTVGLEAPYAYYLELVNRDSLGISGLLKFAVLAEKHNVAYDTAAIKALFTTDLLGNTYVAGNGVYSLCGAMHNTLLGLGWLRILGDEDMIASCINYMLLGKTKGALNTIERAALIDALASEQHPAATPQSLSLQWDENTAVTIDDSRARVKRKAHTVTLHKQGAGIAFAAATVNRFTTNPEVKTDQFTITSSWAAPVVVGTQNELIISVTPAAEAAYVMLEIPIPGGCTVVTPHKTPHYSRGVFQEIKGDKVYVYVEKMAGTFTWTIPVLPRYAGGYTLNPIKAELMYFPTEMGNNAVQRVTIAPQHTVTQQH